MPVDENRQTQIVDYDQQLTREEMLEYAEKAAALEKEREDLSLEQKQSAAAFKAKIGEKEADVRRMLRYVRDGFRPAQAMCYVNYDFKKRVVTFEDCDSGRVVRERKMSEEEFSLPQYRGE